MPKNLSNRVGLHDVPGKGTCLKFPEDVAISVGFFCITPPWAQRCHRDTH